MLKNCGVPLGAPVFLINRDLTLSSVVFIFDLERGFHFVSPLQFSPEDRMIWFHISSYFLEEDILNNIN